MADSVQSFLAEAAVCPPPRYVLRLFITGRTPLSIRAVVNTRKLCEEHLAGRYDLEIVDIMKYPSLAVDDQIIATPTLLKKGPLPPRRFIGDMSKTEHILSELGLRTTVAMPPLMP